MSGPPKEPGKSQGLGEAILSWRSRDWTELTMVDQLENVVHLRLVMWRLPMTTTTWYTPILKADVPAKEGLESIISSTRVTFVEV